MLLHDSVVCALACNLASPSLHYSIRLLIECREIWHIVVLGLGLHFTVNECPFEVNKNSAFSCIILSENYCTIQGGPSGLAEVSMYAASSLINPASPRCRVADYHYQGAVAPFIDSQPRWILPTNKVYNIRVERGACLAHTKNFPPQSPRVAAVPRNTTRVGSIPIPRQFSAIYLELEQ